MKTVYLVRHAKSSWDHPHLTDKDRPLKGRGIRDAHVMSTWFASTNQSEPLILSSPATRAYHTAIIFARNMALSLEAIQVRPSLYGISKEELLHELRGLPASVDQVMVFGHNPCHTDFLNRCISHQVANIPTTGMVGLDFNMNEWANLEFEAELRFFDFPKNLKNKTESP